MKTKKEQDLLVEIRDLKKIYRIGKEKVRALNGLDLDIHRGEILVILGTSGSGKSTFLNMIAGLEKPTKGTVKIMGHDISAMSEKKLAKFRQKHVGFIFQSYNLLPTLTALENVSLPLTFRNTKKTVREKEAAHLLKSVGLGTHIMHKPTQMSGGQQQRVGIARAFAGSPDIIFADEPTGNLDSKTSVNVMGLMIEMARKRNQTLIMVTHDNEVARFGDRVVYILDGVIEKIECKEGDVRRYEHEIHTQ
ncbi:MULTISPECIES: ABC transporter ATP-binding protein [unclassified Fusibacter]|uniref:ABC transporter ATP-binding protein n=1 Tax=unclassified Fusibacter TaxID=2624464 RepID=UPI00101020FA|nr:ABC transporter ATP-binding protein [Fusibacter sp. A1]MCK8059514.1 ABC transporter ATP-binding protein [Fusibacter sp. A2]NPE21022.1 ABC transporter ATP-binding protein [Fusibacter sp. A1]RXV62296.1 ABC transporter ATP-binding protein [Fusibacter sp. A1]